MPAIFQMLIVLVVAFATTYLMVPLSKRLATVIGAIDYPSDRRINNNAIPRCGGIALYLGLLAAGASVWIGIHFFGWTIPDFGLLNDVNLPLLFLGITFMFAVGLADDITQLSPIIKFGGQILAAIIVVVAGVSIETIRSPLDNGTVALGWVDYPITVAFLVVFVNITNLIDGLDGLASGIIAIVSAGLLYLILSRGGFLFALPCIALVGVCLAFLRFNFSPASIFMGDSGAMLLGLLVGIISISGVIRTHSVIIMLVPFVMAGVPLIDTFSAIVRRRRGNQPIQQADMGHVHHRLMEAGLSQRRSVLILYACSALLTIAGALLGVIPSVLGKWLLVVGLALVVLIVIWRFELFDPVLKHYFEHRGERGPRKPHEDEDDEDEG
ncbi:MAG: undecaprenyl/decaprenyl-phosphate alpha-N-acetylglucosaminyl 1-phosphate transferase [Coriobacteriia bacterium]|nr:undecaprenyl/decaprenyl-phosphate alpha-N-acetylglucosaminyl 1-phosphate transferase [Coriobacteriia bacterium]